MKINSIYGFLTLIFFSSAAFSFQGCTPEGTGEAAGPIETDTETSGQPGNPTENLPTTTSQDPFTTTEPSSTSASTSDAMTTGIDATGFDTDQNSTTMGDFPPQDQCNQDSVAYNQAGKGTADDPYQICTLAQLKDLSSHFSAFNKHYVLMNDIDLSPEPGFQIGSSQNGYVFSGSFKGKRDDEPNDVKPRALKNYTVTQDDLPNQALFYKAASATFKNLILENFNISGLTAVAGLVSTCSICILEEITADVKATAKNGTVAGLIAQAQGGKFSHIKATVDLSFSVLGKINATDYPQGFGGLFGLVTNASSNNAPASLDTIEVSGNIREIGPELEIEENAIGGAGIGGLAGILFNEEGNQAHQTMNLTSTVNVQLKSNFKHIGGILGYANDVQLTQSSYGAQMQTAKASTVGGIAGFCIDCHIKRADVLSSASFLSFHNYKGIGGIAGSVYHSDKSINTSMIEQSSSMAQFTLGNQDGDWTFKAGGLVGDLGANAHIKQSFSNVNMHFISTGLHAGGLVGSMKGLGNTIRDSYSLGKITHIDPKEIQFIYLNYVGGIVGSIQYLENVVIERVYSAGQLMGSQYVGGIYGQVAQFSQKGLLRDSFSVAQILAQHPEEAGGLSRISQGLEVNNVYWFDAQPMVLPNECFNDYMLATCKVANQSVFYGNVHAVYTKASQPWEDQIWAFPGNGLPYFKWIP